MSKKQVESPSVRKILWIIFFSTLGTGIMIYLNAFENLHRFMSVYPVFGLKEFIVFFPAFLAMGFVLYAARQIKELEAEIKKRGEAEKALLKSEKRLRALSITDELTGLYNARSFFDELQKEIKRLERYQKPLSLVFLDVNHFKDYNDKYGHLEGDQALRIIAQIIQSCMRGADSAYRYGGDEFAAILPETGEEGAAIVAERINTMVKSRKLYPTPEIAVSISISFGIAEYIPGEEKEAFVKRADMNMYVTKKKSSPPSPHHSTLQSKP